MIPYFLAFIRREGDLGTRERLVIAICRTQEGIVILRGANDDGSEAGDLLDQVALVGAVEAPGRNDELRAVPVGLLGAEAEALQDRGLARGRQIGGLERFLPL